MPKAKENNGWVLEKRKKWINTDQALRIEGGRFFGKENEKPNVAQVGEYGRFGVGMTEFNQTVFGCVFFLKMFRRLLYTPV